MLDQRTRPLRRQQLDDVEVEAVGQDRRRAPPMERLGLLGGDLAHGGEDVGGARGHALERVLGDDVDVARGLLRGSSLETGERQLAQSRERASEHGGVGGEHRADRGRVLVDVEQRGARHPLVPNSTAGLPAGATRSRHQRSTTIPAARPNITGST